MNWKGFVLVALIAIGCGNEEGQNDNPSGGSAAAKLKMYFPTINVPYEISDEELIKKDKLSIPQELVEEMLADSVREQIRGSGGKIKFQGLARVDLGNNLYYLIVKTLRNNQHNAYIIVADNNFKYHGYIPFLQPDNSSATKQVSSIDKNFSITRGIVKKKGSGVIEGKDVYAWDHNASSFSWVMTDKLDEDEELVNPIDTFPTTNKLAGDYVKDQRNKVFVRDGRYPNQLLVYIHTEKGECKGELRGYFLLTSSNTAIYREPGDPCVLQLKFSGSSLSLSEREGCGNYRGLDCPFSATFLKRKAKEKKS